MRTTNCIETVLLQEADVLSARSVCLCPSASNNLQVSHCHHRLPVDNVAPQLVVLVTVDTTQCQFACVVVSKARLPNRSKTYQEVQQPRHAVGDWKPVPSSSCHSAAVDPGVSQLFGSPLGGRPYNFDETESRSELQRAPHNGDCRPLHRKIA